MNILLTVEELAKYLRIKPDTIYKKVRKGELPAIKLGKIVRFPKELIDQWVMEHATKTMKEVRAARNMVESKMEEAVDEVKKTAKIAGKYLGEVPEVIEDVKKAASLKQKQKTLTRGLKALWKDFSAEVVEQRAYKSTKSGTKKKKTGHKNGKAGPLRTQAAHSDTVTAQHNKVL